MGIFVVIEHKSVPFCDNLASERAVLGKVQDESCMFEGLPIVYVSRQSLLITAHLQQLLYDIDN